MEMERKAKMEELRKEREAKERQLEAERIAQEEKERREAAEVSVSSGNRQPCLRLAHNHKHFRFHLLTSLTI